MPQEDAKTDLNGDILGVVVEDARIYASLYTNLFIQKASALILVVSKTSVDFKDFKSFMVKERQYYPYISFLWTSCVPFLRLSSQMTPQPAQNISLLFPLLPSTSICAVSAPAIGKRSIGA